MNDKYTFREESDRGDSITMSYSIDDCKITDVFELFIRFLKACSFSEELIEQYLSEEAMNELEY